jgi:hypothetical protein
MRRHRFVPLAAGLALTLLAAAGCGSSHSTKDVLAAGDLLAERIIPAPDGYGPDPTVGATGTMTPTVFDQDGGAGSASKAGFVVGYKQDYIDTDTVEGLTVTLIEFSTEEDAVSYFQDTAPETLSYAAATRSTFSQIPGALAFAGTKEYAGEYAHGIALTNGKYYALVVYVNALSGTPPFELGEWAKAQYLLLGLKTPVPVQNPNAG